MILSWLLPPLDTASAAQKQEASFVVEGSIKDMLGRPISGAAVSLESQDGRRSEQITSNDRGGRSFGRRQAPDVE
jgi:hypothetical protein